MAKYPFKINIQFKDGTTKPHYTSSFATDDDTVISASAMVDKINLIPFANAYTQDNVPAAMHPSRKFGLNDEGHKWLSASYTHANTGSVVFTDTEDTDNGGLDYYTFWGTKVCSVLGLPEGIPIYTETFKLSDDSSNPSNYLSGDVVANGVAVKESFKMAPQGRMKSNLVWDHQFGEGLLQWVSGSTTKASLGYDDQNDRYTLNAQSASVSRVEADVVEINNQTQWVPISISCGFNYSSAGGTTVVVPFTSLYERTTTDNYTEYQIWIAPFDCYWAKVYARSEVTPGATWVNMYIVDDGTEGETISAGSNTVGDAFGLLNMTTANTVYTDGGINTSAHGGAAGKYISAGQTIIFTVNPAADMDDVTMTFLFYTAPKGM